MFTKCSTINTTYSENVSIKTVKNNLTDIGLVGTYHHLTWQLGTIILEKYTGPNCHKHGGSTSLQNCAIPSARQHVVIIQKTTQTHLHLIRRLRTCHAVPPLPHMPSYTQNFILTHFIFINIIQNLLNPSNNKV